LSATRCAFSGRRLVLAFQPHRFSRTRDCFEDFVAVMAKADAVLLTEVFAAGETPLASADGQALARALQSKGAVIPEWVAGIEALPERIIRVVRDGDVVLTMGAGSIGSVAKQVVKRLGVGS
jgi:UDP-N-acetylmuramate--alanine ligase